MAWTLEELQHKYVTATHPGSVVGITHFVDGNAYCLEPTSIQEEAEQQYCAQRAGQGTDHSGTGSCRWHWGNLPPRMAQYSKYLKGELRQRFLEFQQMDDMALMDLRPELTLLRTLLTSTTQAYQANQSNRAMDLTLKVLDNISSTVDRIDRIQSRQTLTAATAKVLFLKAIQVSKTFIPLEHMPAFLDMWRAEIASYMENPNGQPLLSEGDVLDGTFKDADQ